MIRIINQKKRSIILHGNIITPFQLLENKAIFIENGEIIEIKDEREINTATLIETEIIEAQGKFVVPGYIDIHIHGGGGSDVMDGDWETINQIAITHSCFGTTSFLPTTMTMSKNKIIKS
ncbi:MAG TPA: hypothetical protein ENG48_09415, partial [Candidatus Atribacteria bacterium]|nr:hypothetical protein [Candidatus Atribacteria bacterium]